MRTSFGATVVPCGQRLSTARTITRSFTASPPITASPSITTEPPSAS